MEEKLKQQPSNCIKVVLFGPESTGKTTLSRQLARHYNSVWVPEYARDYLQNKWNNERKTCEPKDLLPIGIGQMKLENHLAQKTDTVLICDTNLLETKVYSEAYYKGTCDPTLETHALENFYDLYFLTYIDTPWEADDLRDKPKERELMFDAFENALKTYNKPYVILKGNKKERLALATKHIDKLFRQQHMKFTEVDIKQIESKGLNSEKVNAQIELFKTGIPFTNISEAATINNGIIALNDNNIKTYLSEFNAEKDNKSLLKFVPASGAATRMFKFLFQFVNNYNADEQSLNSYINKNKIKELPLFMVGMEKFPFYNQVLELLKSKGTDFETLPKHEQVWLFAKTMLDENELNFGNQPKGLLPFHEYKTDHVSTAFEEHLYEAALYASSKGLAKLHFTISETHKDKFTAEFEKIQKDVEENTGVTFEISFSYQQQSTDTIAVTLDNQPFKEADGSILFRPSGHGALLKNLNALDADIIFVKNIDNVVVYKYKEEIAKYKQVLAGILLKLQSKTIEYLHTLDTETISEATFKTIEKFITSSLNIKISDEYKKYTNQYKIEYLQEKLNRPIRICGMVKNEGEPGGGPFWVKDEKSNVSLQIVESAQINLGDQQQADLLKNATHFNPVDLVCGVKNYKGEKFDLENYVDHNAAFITQKTKNGKDLKALELPGLWNGSMADWITIFVEVPIITFNPVKTVNDLLKAPHQIKE